ncbi:hypothetical protein D0U04_06605 [Bacillus clarus]|uniref:Group-specific protein n=1 Tax=Bacillus clarus TaxID=2338372 RepID=A0ABX9KZH0_9BACI|nr:hypothetical protein D0U04_06605 [Bacillus clarus]
MLIKTSFSEKKSDNLAFVVTVFLSCLIGTCLDIFFVNKRMYDFPLRPFPSIFSINIAFTLFILPIFTTIFLQLSKRLSSLSNILFIIFIGVCASIFEQIAERLGLFVHSENWHHTYSLFGYMIFLFFIWRVYRRIQC